MSSISKLINASRSVFVCLLVAMLLGSGMGPAWAELRGMVIRVKAEEIVVNVGLQKNVRPGTSLYVYDAAGKPVATVRVTEVDDYSSKVEITGLEPGTVLGVGNTVSDTSYKPQPVAAKTPMPQNPVVSPTPTTTPSPSRRPETAVKGFVDSLKRHTHIYMFKGGKGGTVKVNAGDVLNILSTVFLGPAQSAAVNPWLVSSTVMNSYGVYSTTAKTNQRPRSCLEVVYWDRELLGAYADYYVYKQNLGPSSRDEVFRNLLAQKGVDTSVIFQVKIVNRGPGTMQLAPFDWHVYIIDPAGNRVKAERYDEILDKALNAGQEVAGYIYFPRRDPTGKSYVSNPLTMLVEDVFGERTVIRWGGRDD